jgi:hypothetical protein
VKQETIKAMENDDRPVRKKKRPNKPFKVFHRSIREKGMSYGSLEPMMASLFEWRQVKEFATQKEAEKWIAKQKRAKSFRREEYRIDDEGQD